MRRNKFTTTMLLVASAVFAAHNGNAQTKNEFSVKQTVDYGLKNAVQVKNALIDIKNQEQSNREITSQALPQIYGTAGVNRNFNIQQQPINDFISPAVYGVLDSEQVRSGRTGQVITLPDSLKSKTLTVGFGSPWSSTAGITLNQVLFDGQVFVGLKARKVALDFYRKQAEVTEEQIKANIYKVYYQLVVGQKQLSSVQSNIGDINKQLHDTKEIYKQGFAEKLDIDKLTVQLNNLQTQEEVVENQIEAGNASLKFLIGMPQKEELILTDTLNDEELKADSLNESYNYNDRKDMQLLTLNAKLQGYNVTRYQMTRIPTLSATANYSKNAFGNDLGFITSGPWYTSSYVGVNINVPIFSGFYKSAKIQEAKLALQETNNNLSQLKASIDNDVAQARISMKSALATMDNQKQNIQLAESVYSSTRLKYEQGLGSNQETYDAQTQLQLAQNNYYNALYDAIIAKINYLQAVGKLP